MKMLKIKTFAAMTALTVVTAASTTIALNHSTARAAEQSDVQEQSQFIRTAVTGAFETDFTKVAEKTINTVVCIKSFATRKQSPYNSYDSDPFGMFDFFFGPQPRQQQPRQQQKQEPVQTGLGSGVILSSDGYIVTNNHVIADADRLEILLNDNSTYDAYVVGTDPATDLALIKIDATGLPYITFGDSDKVKIGEWVLAVGNPFGFNSTVTAGIISAKARSLGHQNQKGNMSIESFLQTDAALNPGNSGGALVNLKGELIGINSAIYSNTGSYSGFSFAIPTSIVKKVMTDLKQYGLVNRAVLGIQFVELTPQLARELEFDSSKTGILVKDVVAGSTAAEMGIKKDAIIVAINDQPVTNGAELQEQINKYRPGDKIVMKYYDPSNYKVLKSAQGTLLDKKGKTEIAKKSEFSELGCAFMKLTAENKKSLNLRSGVKVTGLKNGAIKEAGVREGFIITEINNRPVNSSDEVEAIYNSVMKGDDDHVLFLTGIYPGGKKYYYAVNLDD